jgi:hypothetical protein
MPGLQVMSLFQLSGLAGKESLTLGLSPQKTFDLSPIPRPKEGLERWNRSRGSQIAGSQTACGPVPKTRD